MKIKKIDEDKFEIKHEPVIETVSIKELQNEVKTIETEKVNYEEKFKIIFDTQKDFLDRISNLKNKIEEIKQAK